MGKPFNKTFARGRGGANRGGRGGAGRGGKTPTVIAMEQDGTKDSDKLQDSKIWDELDEKLGFSKYSQGPAKIGWLVNMQQVRNLNSWLFLNLD